MKSLMKTIHGLDKGNQGKNGGLAKREEEPSMNCCKREGSTGKD